MGNGRGADNVLVTLLFAKIFNECISNFLNSPSHFNRRGHLFDMVKLGLPMQQSRLRDQELTTNHQLAASWLLVL